jgi:putative ATP-dependent endonuclease of the OLD family
VARIRKIEVRNFRSIRTLDWLPSSGINCLVGPGDSGKSTILDAVDLCIGLRRQPQMADTDFFALDVTNPIEISLTLGELPDSLKNLDAYGDFLRGWDGAAGSLEDEPRHGLETVVTLVFSVLSDLEPTWRLYSQRAEAQGLERNVAWKDRSSIAAARIGSYASANLSWTRGSVLNKISEDRLDLSAELARAARDARANFGEQAGAQLADALATVKATAGRLGVPVGDSVKALLDAHSVSITDGAIALHNDAGVPLRSLGTGSSRLLVAGLQRAASEAASIALVDEVEFGLEPHRLMRFLDSLGAKEETPPLQVFMTTHSPVVVRELAGAQLSRVLCSPEEHRILPVGEGDEVQSTLRADPEAFLAKSVLVCEGASEVGFVRGIDLYRSGTGFPSLLARGVAYVNVGGRDPDKCFTRGTALLKLGYRAFVLVDADREASAERIEEFEAAGGHYVTWRPGRALEDEVFLSVSNRAVHSLLQRAELLLGRELVAAHIGSVSNGRASLDSVLAEGLTDGYSHETRTVLARASKTKDNGWFKSVTRFQGVARDIVAPDLRQADADFVRLVETVLGWGDAA